MSFDLSGYDASCEHITAEGNRIKVVQAAVELLIAEVSSDRETTPMINLDDAINPVKRYADWIEEALKIAKKV